MSDSAESAVADEESSEWPGSEDPRQESDWREGLKALLGMFGAGTGFYLCVAYGEFTPWVSPGPNTPVNAVLFGVGATVFALLLSLLAAVFMVVYLQWRYSHWRGVYGGDAR